MLEPNNKAVLGKFDLRNKSVLQTSWPNVEMRDSLESRRWQTASARTGFRRYIRRCFASNLTRWSELDWLH